MYIARCQEAGDMPPGANPRHMHQHWHQINTDLGPVVQRLLLGLCCLCLGMSNSLLAAVTNKTA